MTLTRITITFTADRKELESKLTEDEIEALANRLLMDAIGWANRRAAHQTSLLSIPIGGSVTDMA